jgi:hypothetical protein
MVVAVRVGNLRRDEAGSASPGSAASAAAASRGSAPPMSVTDRVVDVDELYAEIQSRRAGSRSSTF